MVSHSCLLIELVHSIAASLQFKSYKDHNLLKSYKRDLWKKTLTGVGPSDASETSIVQSMAT